ncbi:ESPR domain-containing protein [Actinobacillus delphinicola]|uniref:ESPR domain-containing protein n=1 Tax=Actinobacillus delphinicola TaxID=51161 RepID=A0A448TU03_9PAST|nr:ESPR domain-containing protein [Actinobacillus delphinicola]VEJ09416.1 Uncharacterised protein [Actinobacillus delphinicola]
MNRIFKIIFDRINQRLVVVSELAKSTTKTGRNIIKNTAILGCTLLISGQVLATDTPPPSSHTYKQSYNFKKLNTKLSSNNQKTIIGDNITTNDTSATNVNQIEALGKNLKIYGSSIQAMGNDISTTDSYVSAVGNNITF